MFVLAKDETEELVTNCDRFASIMHSSVPMRAFSEHGVIMVASVLKNLRGLSLRNAPSRIASPFALKLRSQFVGALENPF